MALSNEDPRHMLTRFFEVKLEEPGCGRKQLLVLIFHLCLPDGDECKWGEQALSGILLYGKGFESIKSYNHPPTLVVNDRPVELPEPDGMLYVVGTSYVLCRVEVQASELEHYLDEGIMDQFYKTEDWTHKLWPAIALNEWTDWPYFSRN
jgi:hypothetical protein